MRRKMPTGKQREAELVPQRDGLARFWLLFARLLPAPP
jgi:hypothetical protein